MDCVDLATSLAVRVAREELSMRSRGTWVSVAMILLSAVATALKFPFDPKTIPVLSTPAKGYRG